MLKQKVSKQEAISLNLGPEKKNLNKQSLKSVFSNSKKRQRSSSKKKARARNHSKSRLRAPEPRTNPVRPTKGTHQIS